MVRSNRCYLASCLLLFSSLPLAPALPATTPAPFLAADLEPGSRERSPGFSDVAAFGQLIAMAGSDPAHGSEPWLSDGTAAGTRRIADVAPGLDGSLPRLFLALPGKLLFRAYDGYGSFSLYSYAGDLAGGELTRLAGGADDARVAGERAFFTTHPSSGARLYETDGTAAGTRLVAALCDLPDLCSGEYPTLFAFGDALVFSYRNGLYRVDPGQAPVLVRSEFGRIGDLLPLGDGRFAMRAHHYPDPNALWISDGTAAGTFRFDLNDPTLGGFYDLATFGGRVYGANGAGRVFSAAGTPDSLRLESSFPGDVGRIVGAAAGGLFYLRRVANRNRLWLYGTDGVHRDTDQSATNTFAVLGSFAGRVLLTDFVRQWRSDGTLAGTQQVAALGLTGELGTAVVGDAIYYAGNPAGPQTGKWGLYRVGLSGPAAAVVATLPTPAGSAPRAYAAGDQLVVADDPAPADYSDANRLWRLDPESLVAELADPRAFTPLRSNGQVLLAQVASFAEEADLVAVGSATTTELGPVPRVAESAVRTDGSFVFSEFAVNELLWRSDGTPAGTGVLADLLNGGALPEYCQLNACLAAAMPAGLTVSGERTFFVAAGPPDSLYGSQLYVQQGAAAPVALAELGEVSYPEELPRLLALPGGRVAVLIPRDPLAGSIVQPPTLTVSDGTAAGTVGGLWTFREVDYERPAAILGSRLLATDGDQLWSIDTASGAGEVLLAGPRIFRLVSAGDQVFYVAADEDSGGELWRTDGTVAGTRRLEIRPGGLSALAREVEIYPLGDGRVAFAADDGAAGNELFLSDGTAAGTIRLADIAPGPAASNPRHFHRRGDRLFFAADDGVHGDELWALDLPPALPACPPDTLCLLDGRFEAKVTAVANGQAFVGQRALASSESGVFTFFGPDNWEMMVKLLDGCAINQRFWVFASAATDVAYELVVRDRATGAAQTYRHAAGSPATPAIDLGAFAGCALPAPQPVHSTLLPLPPPARRCPGDAEALCLGDGGRFRVKASWQTAGDDGPARPVPFGSLDSGLFTFFSPANWELLVKVLDGCTLNGHHWIFAAGTTDVGWRLEVEDLVTHEIHVYENPLGHPSLTITDSAALGGCP